MIQFSLPEEEHWFSERHPGFLELLPTLNDTLDNVLKHTVTADRQGVTVFMLGRRCANDFSEILLLASNGYGFAALQILRSMFEKLVDARYLHDNPTERRMADVALHQSLLFLILVLQLEVEHYGWEDSALEVQQLLDLFGSYMQSLAERKD